MLNFHAQLSPCDGYRRPNLGVNLWTGSRLCNQFLDATPEEIKAQLLQTAIKQPTTKISKNMNINISFTSDGTAQCLWTEALPLHELGRLEITRASNIEFNNADQQWEVRTEEARFGSLPGPDPPVWSGSNKTCNRVLRH